MAKAAPTIGWAKTFQVLAKTPNEAAAELLLPLLDSPDPRLQQAAVAALLDRRSVAGQHAVVRRLDRWGEAWRPLLEARRGRFSQALRDAVVSTDVPFCQNACQAILWFKEYDLVPALVNALEDEGNPNADLVARTLVELVELLYADLASPRDYRDRRDPQLVRRHVTTSLESSVKRYIKHRRMEVLEAFLLLAGRDNATLRKVLIEPLDPAHKPLLLLLSESQRAGVMRLLLSALDDPQPITALLQIIGGRSDAKFVGHLLARIGHAPAAGVAQNLKKITHLAWLQQETTELLARLDGPAQHAAVQLVTASGLKRQASFDFLALVLRSGQVGGRRAAVAALADHQGADANQLIQQALADPDPLVQAGALAQIRRRGIPGALGRLIAALDSPQPALRQAARESLGEFSLARFLAAFDTLEEAVRLSTGRLVAKVDVEAVPTLIAEMQSAARTRRLKAVEVARYVDVFDALEPTVMGLLAEDDDHLVRREAARTLSRSRSAAARAALEQAVAHDRNVPVQEAALESLEGWRVAPLAPSAGAPLPLFPPPAPQSWPREVSP